MDPELFLGESRSTGVKSYKQNNFDEHVEKVQISVTFLLTTFVCKFF